MRIGSLFAGIGGFDLAARWMGWETAWFSEIDPYASAVLRKHWPGVPNHGDITQIDFTQVEPVDMLCGGFPCQDISNAGKRAGIGGERSGLWGEYARAVRELRPRYVVVENVAALLGRGLDRVLGDLASLGYDAEWQVLSATDVGAPHLRERVWIVANSYRLTKRLQSLSVPERGDATVPGDDGPPGIVADTLGLRKPQPEGCFTDIRRWTSDGSENVSEACPSSEVADPCQPRLPNVQGSAAHGQLDGERGVGRDGSPSRADSQWRVEPDVGRVAHGVPARVDRLGCLGNSLVPECAYQIFQEIEVRETAMRSVA